MSISIKEIKKTLKDAKQKHENLQQQMASNTKNVVNILKDVIQGIPEVEAVKWSQYTPYFNDGDVCEFGVHDLGIKFVNEVKASEQPGKYCYSDENGFLFDYDYEDYFESQKEVINFEEMEERKREIMPKLKVLNEIHEALSEMSESLKQAFGDHTTVIVTKNGIETEECSHD